MMGAEPREEISSYLLGELDAQATGAFEARLAEDAELREEVERLRPLVAELEALPGETWEPAEPPPLALPGEAAAPDAPAAPTRESWWRRALTLRPLPAAGLAAVLLAVGIGIGALLNSSASSTEATQAQLTLSRFDDGPAAANGQVLVADSGDRATVDVSGLRPTGADDFYELWLLDENGEMIAVGAFQVGEDGRADVQLPLPVAPSRYQYFDVSLQRDNGDPSHSGISVLRGPTQS
jgi:anti-sigma-K factor RskA